MPEGNVIVLEHSRLMAGYNLRMNRQVYAAAASLDERALSAEAGAYFGSILGTLNHLLVGDLIWLRRFVNHSPRYLSLQALAELPQPSRLDQILYPNLNTLATARTLVDETLLAWATRELEAEDLTRPLTYGNVAGRISTRQFGELLMHLFNHQTHHRGQVSTLLSQRGVDVGVTDFLVDIPRLDEPPTDATLA